MWVQDEVKDYAKYESLYFVDFLEALGRVADLKALPAQSELERNGYSDVFEWLRSREAMSDDVGLETHRSGEAPPLSEKLTVLLDLVFRMLHYEPSQPDSIFSYDSLLKIIKKKDKEMGP